MSLLPVVSGREVVKALGTAARVVGTASNRRRAMYSNRVSPKANLKVWIGLTQRLSTCVSHFGSLEPQKSRMIDDSYRGWITVCVVCALLIHRLWRYFHNPPSGGIR